MVRRRHGPDETPQLHRRMVSDFAPNGEGSNFEGVYRGLDFGGGKSQFRFIANAIRSRLRQVIKAGQRQGLARGLGFLAACLLMVWCGLHLPRLLGEGAGEGTVGNREGLQAFAVAEAALSGVAGSRTRGNGDDTGPRLAYGIMVYQRKGSTVEKTLGQFTRMFNALYDTENTSLDVPAGVTQEEGHTGFLIHLLSAPEGDGVSVVHTTSVRLPDVQIFHDFGSQLQYSSQWCNTTLERLASYVVHVDIKSDEELRDEISAFLAKRDNAHQVRSVSVSWGGVTVVERTLALMQKALEVDDSWRFFVNLGHEDYPSISQKEAREWMKDQPDGTNFIKCWPIEGHDFFGQREHHESRVTDVHVDDFVGGVKEYRTLAGKPGSRERPATDYKFYKSLQQTMLSRQLTDYAVTSSEARRLLLYMATSKAPDELYFPTLTQLDPMFSDMATCNDTRHFSYWIRPGGSWHPEYLTLDHLPLVLKSDNFYIRKISPEWQSELLLDVLDLLREGKPLDGALPKVKWWLNRRGEDGTALGAPGGPIIEFTEGTIDEAIAELYRRESEDAEAKRCRFMSYVTKRGAEIRAASRAASQAQGGPPKQPFLDRSQLSNTNRAPAKGGGGRGVNEAVIARTAK